MTIDRQTSRRVHGFTLIELLVVISILALLASIIIPSVAAALQGARQANTIARIQQLSDAATQFRLGEGDSRYYPGQDDVSEWKDNAGLTGSQLLAFHAFDYVDTSATPDPSYDYADVSNGNFEPRSGYVDYKQGYLFNPTDEGGPDRPRSISDGMKPPMTICYYPSRLGQTGLDQYVYSDNSAYTDGNTGGNNDSDEFDSFITNDRFGDQPWNDGGFLLIAPGADRLYFTSDDIRNW